MILTFELDTPNFYIETNDIILLFSDYKNNDDKKWITLYRDNLLICHYKADYEDFKNEILKAKKNFIKENINNKEELDKYEYFFMDLLKMITLIERERKEREE